MNNYIVDSSSSFMSAIPSIHIIIGGKQQGHVSQGLSHLKADAVHVITSKRFESDYAQKMDDWSEEFGTRRGMLIAIPTAKLFSESAVDEIRGAMISICEEEGVTFPIIHSSEKWKSPTNCRFLVNITGGTNLMGGAAVHASGTIGATCYYVIEKGEDGEGFPLIFPSLDLVNVISQHSRNGMSELLERPIGQLRSLHSGGSLVMDLCVRGMATIEYLEDGQEDGRYEISEESKRLLYQTIQNRAQDSEVKTAKDMVASKNEVEVNKSDESGKGRFSLFLGSFPSEKCDNSIYRSYMERYDLEFRAELWERGKDNEMGLRTYFARAGSPHGGSSWDSGSIKEFEERWRLPKEIDRFILSSAWRYYDSQKEADELARIVSSESPMDKFAEYWRHRALLLGFKVDGSRELPGGV